MKWYDPVIMFYHIGLSLYSIEIKDKFIIL